MVPVSPRKYISLLDDNKGLSHTGNVTIPKDAMLWIRSTSGFLSLRYHPQPHRGAMSFVAWQSQDSDETAYPAGTMSFLALRPRQGSDRINEVAHLHSLALPATPSRCPRLRWGWFSYGRASVHAGYFAPAGSQPERGASVALAGFPKKNGAMSG